MHFTPDIVRLTSVALLFKPTKQTRARGVAGLTRLPVTEEIAGSNPVGPAKLKQYPIYLEYGIFCFMAEDEFTPNLAEREDSRFWYVDSKMNVTKPGDTVIISEVCGDSFGEYSRIKHLGIAATFLLNFNEDEQSSIELAKVFCDPGEIDALSPEEVDSFSRMPYFSANFEGIGTITFSGMECFWGSVQDQ